MKEIVQIRNIRKITRDVLEITTEKPEGFSFKPGQATEVSINKEGWKEKWRPFTFTSLPGEDHLEFIIKVYPSHEGVTARMLQLAQGDELILQHIFGNISYRGEGIFIAGGSGITPFVAILRQLEEEGGTGNNQLLFANKTRADIIHKEYFQKLLGDNFINILSDEKTDEYAHGFITKELLQEHFEPDDPYIYLCGPPPMMKSVEKMTGELGIGEEKVVKEAFG